MATLLPGITARTVATPRLAANVLEREKPWNGPELERKPPILWTHGAADAIVSDASFFDLKMLGSAGGDPGLAWRERCTGAVDGEPDPAGARPLPGQRRRRPRGAFRRLRALSAPRTSGRVSRGACRAHR
jgi:hypothetical protein